MVDLFAVRLVEVISKLPGDALWCYRSQIKNAPPGSKSQSEVFSIS
jgi:hypothetical protein